MLTMRTPLTRPWHGTQTTSNYSRDHSSAVPWHNAILLFFLLFALPAAPSLLAEEGTQEIDGATSGDACRDAFELCSRSYAPGSPNWKDCLEKEAMLMEHDPQCPNRWKEWGLLDELPMPVPPPIPGEEWNRGGWRKRDHEGWEEEEEGQEGESDGGEWGAEEDDEEDTKEEWLSGLEENLGDFDEETQKCMEKTIQAKRDRCAVSSVDDCEAKTAFKALVTEAKCGGEIFNVVEFEESGAGETHDFQESFEEHREGGGGCVPFHATLEGVKEEMFGRTPEEILAEFERRKHWMAKMATEHGGNPEEMMKKFDGMPACEGGGPGGGHQGPPMVMPGMMMGSRDGTPGPSIGEIFGRAVGMLVELSQRSELSDEQKALVRETLSWFSDALNRVGAGEDVGPLAAEAREKLENLMATMGGGSIMSNIEMMQSEIERMLTMVQMMVEKIPTAMAMMAEMGYAVEGWEAYYDEIKEQAAKVEEICREKLSAAASPDQFRECFDAMHKLFKEKMERMGEYMSKSVPPDTMRAVEEKMGFNEMGMPGEDRGPPEGMEPMEYRGKYHEGKEGYPMMPMDRMKPPMVSPVEGMHIPEEYKRIGQECFDSGGTKEECRRRISEAMFQKMMDCDQRTGGNFEECAGGLKQEFNLSPGALPPSGE